jgi:hypothetical protein
LALTSTSVAPLAGNVEATSGLVAPACGSGAATVKSAALLSVPVALPFRWTDVVFEGGVGPVPSKQLAVVPWPTKSTIAPPVGQAPLSATSC